MNIVFIILFIFIDTTSAQDFRINLNATLQENRVHVTVTCATTVPLFISKFGITAHHVYVYTELKSSTGKIGLMRNVEKYYIGDNRYFWNNVVETFLFEEGALIFCNVDVSWHNAAGYIILTGRNSSSVLMEAKRISDVPKTASTRKTYHIPTIKTTNFVPRKTDIPKTTSRETIYYQTTPTSKATYFVPRITDTPKTAWTPYESTTASQVKESGSCESSSAYCNQYFSNITDKSWFKAVACVVVIIIAVIVIFGIVRILKKKPISKNGNLATSSHLESDIYSKPNIRPQDSTHTKNMPISPEVLYSQPIPKRERNNGKVQNATVEFENTPIYSQVLLKSVQNNTKTSKSAYANADNIRNHEPTYAEVQNHDTNSYKKSNEIESGYAQVQTNYNKTSGEYTNVFKGHYGNSKNALEYVEPCYSEVNKVV